MPEIGLMKITIDTKEDSHSEIKKAIKMLQTIVGEEAYTNYEKPANMFEENSKPAENGASNEGMSMFGAMFGDNSSAANTALKEEPNVETKKEDDDDIPMIEFY